MTSDQEIGKKEIEPSELIPVRLEFYSDAEICFRA